MTVKTRAENFESLWPSYSAAMARNEDLPPEQRIWRQRVEEGARELCARWGLDPDAQIVFGPPAYLGIDVCYPIAFYVPPEERRERLWTIFSRQAELVLAAIDEKTPSKEDQ